MLKLRQIEIRRSATGHPRPLRSQISPSDYPGPTAHGRSHAGASHADRSKKKAGQGTDTLIQLGGGRVTLQGVTNVQSINQLLGQA